MSVLIKGMEMPTNCRKCSLYLQSMDSERNVYENCAVTAKSYNWGLTTRPLDCPLVEIPPHGRLIDADALINAIVNTPSEVQNKDIPLTTQYDGSAFRQIEILGMIEALPIIMPTEEDE